MRMYSLCEQFKANMYFEEKGLGGLPSMSAFTCAAKADASRCGLLSKFEVHV
jgi:hypothetical protein